MVIPQEDVAGFQVSVWQNRPQEVQSVVCEGVKREKCVCREEGGSPMNHLFLVYPVKSLHQLAYPLLQ